MHHHTAEYIIDLESLAHNYRTYTALLPTGGRIVPIIKADAYGTGVLPVVRRLEKEGADYFAVALMEEAVEIREAGIKGTILVLNPDIQTVHLAFLHHLEIETYSIHLLRYLDEVTRQKKLVLRIHIKVDTGMHRLGILERDIDEAISIIKNNPYLQLSGIMSHLASSEDPDDDPFSRRQVMKYDEVYERISHALEIEPMRHISNTAAIARSIGTSYELARLGLGLYGVNMTETSLQLKRVHNLIARVLQVKWVKKGGSIGYNRRKICQKDTKVAIINIGYADGISRRLGNENYHMLVRNQKAAILGSVSMDTIALDVTHISDVSVNDKVEVFGDHLPVEEMAVAMGSIPYEILCGISYRIKRVYR